MSNAYYDSPLRSTIDPLTGLPRKKKQAGSGATPYANQGPSAWGPGGPGWEQTQGLLPGGGSNGGGSSYNPFTVAGSTPDYQALINGDPLYAQAKLDFGAQGVADAASRAAMTQRALTLFGHVPQFDGLTGLNPDWLNSDVTDQTKQLAQQNTDAGLSIVARQDKAFKDQLRTIKNALAARGALQSGETGHALQEAQLGRDQASFDTTNELVKFITGLQSGYAESQRTLQDKQRAAAEAAAARARADHPATADRKATWNGSGYVYEDGTPVPRELWPSQPDAATPPQGGASDPISAAELDRMLRRGTGGRNYQAF